MSDKKKSNPEEPTATLKFPSRKENTGRATGRPVHMPPDVCLALYQQVDMLPPEKKTTFVTLISSKNAVFDITPDPKNTRRIGYVAAAEACQAVGIRLVEIFAQTGRPLNWPTKTMEEMDAIMCSMPPEVLAKVESLMLDLAPDNWLKEGRDYAPNPSLRALWLINNKSIWARDKKATANKAAGAIEDVPSPAADWGRKILSPSGGRKCSATIEQCLAAAKEMEMIPTWILGLADGKYAVLSTSAKSEYILAAYCAMGESNKRIFAQAVKSYKGVK